MDTPSIIIKHLGIFRHSKAGDMIPWNENCCFYCRTGSLSLRVNDVAYTLKRGMIFIHSPFSKVIIEKASEDLDGVVCGVDYDIILSITKTLSINENLLFFARNPIVPITEKRQRTMEDLIDMIMSFRADNKVPLRPQLIRTLEMALFYQILSDYFETHPISRNFQDRNNLILWNFQRDLDKYGRQHKEVKFYATLQNLSPRYFSNVIHRLSGKTVQQWIIQTVITEAKNMILHSHKSFKEIAFDLNFTNPSAFARYFRQYTGISPSEFRETGMDFLPQHNDEE